MHKSRSLDTFRADENVLTPSDSVGETSHTHFFVVIHGAKGLVRERRWQLKPIMLIGTGRIDSGRD